MIFFFLKKDKKEEKDVKNEKVENANNLVGEEIKLDDINIEKIKEKKPSKGKSSGISKEKKISKEKVELLNKEENK